MSDTQSPGAELLQIRRAGAVRTRRAPRPRVALIGHITAEPNVVLAEDDQARRRLLVARNYTRVVTPDGHLTDHLTYLSEITGIAPLSIWEMDSCSVLLLGSHLRRHGFDVHLVNYIDSTNEAPVFAQIAAFGPDLVVLSTTFVLSQPHLVHAVRLIKHRLPGAFVLCGGQHVYTALLPLGPEQRCAYFAASGADGFVNDSQGELSLLAVCRSYPDDLAGVPNLVLRTPDGIVETPRAPENNDINWTPIEGALVAGACVHLRTARSCTFKCAFCSYPTVAGKLAVMDLDLVMATLEACKQRGVASVFFVDDTFNVPRQRFEALLDRMIAAGLDLPWYSFLRCQFVDEPLVDKMQRSGCRGVFLGIESASDELLKRMQKGAAVAAYARGVRWLRDRGIVTVGSFLLGFPGETERTVAETQRFIAEAGLDYYYIQPFYYLHHAPVHQRAAELGLEGKGLFWSHDTMNSRQALAHIDRIFLETRGPIWVNPDMTLWEIAYLKSKGMSADQIDGYRRTINALTAAQMRTFRIEPHGTTAQSAAAIQLGAP